MRNLLVLLILLQLVLVGCNKISSVGGGRVEIKATLEKPLSSGTDASGLVYNFVSVSCVTAGNVWDGSKAQNSSPTVISSGEYYAEKNTNLSCIVGISNLKDLGCQTVKVDAYLDGKKFDTRTFELGVIDISIVPAKYCQDVNYTAGTCYFNVIVP